MGTRYCPECGSEYRAGFDVCADCGVGLVDEAPVPLEPGPAEETDAHHWVQVMSTGRSMDAEIVRSFLEGNGLSAEIWSSGLGRWRAESALTEVTGVPSDFNAYRVMVPDDQVVDARELLEASDAPELEEEDWALPPAAGEGGSIGDTGMVYGFEADGEPLRWMQLFRSKWVLTGVALFTLALILLGALR